MAEARATQSGRVIEIDTPLGADVLLLRSISGREELGRPFSFELDLLSTDYAIDFKAIVGQNVTVGLALSDGVRHINGYVSRFVQTGMMGPRYAEYRATIVPWLWFLTRTSDCRIFQQMKVPDIVKKVFSDFGFSDVEDRLAGSYPTWNYCVQYRETAFNFVSRLMEQEGIYYYFAHASGKHTLVLCDSLSKHDPYEGYSEIPYRSVDEADTTEEHISDWLIGQSVQPGTYAHTDYNFTKPRTLLHSQSTIEGAHTRAGYEIYDFPGEYGERGDGGQYARTRIEELHARHEVLSGHSDARGIAVGHRFALTDYPREDQNREYLVTAATYEASSPEYESEGGARSGAVYACRFETIPAAVQFRTERLTAKPVVHGLQTAVVVGPSGEEIHTDKYGRVKVQFHWDRYSKGDETSSCWIRVAQVWAGKKWGAVYTPRIGQEVVVEFVEGDPDQPLITGRVYNDVEMPPYELPANQTMSTLKSNSSKGGQGFNEIRYEDKKGSEQIFIHAEKDEDERVKNDSREWIGHDRHLIVKHDQFELVELNKHSTVRGNRLLKTLGNRDEIVKGDHKAKIDGSDHLTVKGDECIEVSGDVNFKTDGNLNTEAAQKISIKAGMNLHGKAGMNYAMDAGVGVHIKGGMTVVVEAGLQLSLKAGASFIDIGPAGIALSGAPLVLINSGGAAGSGGGASPVAPQAPDAPATAKEPAVAATDKPGSVDKPPPVPTPPKPVRY